MRNSFQTCPTCGRLNLAGQQCCTAAFERPCDCHYDGNRQIVGELCRVAMRGSWALFMNTPRPLLRS